MKTENRMKSILEIVNYYKVSNALFIMVETGVFEYINGINTVKEISNKVNVDCRALTIIFDLFVSIGLLVKKEKDLYTLVSAYEGLFDKRSAYNCLDLIKLESYLSKEHTGYKSLEKAVITGKGIDSFNINNKEGKEELYLNTMNQGSQFASICVARELNKAKGRVLDIGGGSGIYSIASAKLNKNLSIEIIDKSEIREICEKNISDSGLENQIEFISGDITKMELRGRYEAIILSNILHLLSQNDIEKLFKQLDGVLTDYGMLIFHDFFVREDNPVISRIYTLDWLMHGSFFSYTIGEFSEFVQRYNWKVKAVKQYDKIDTTIIVVYK